MVVPARTEENGSFLVCGGDATRREVIRQLFGEDVPIVGCPTELGNSVVERRHGNPALSTICCDLASGPTNNVKLIALTRSQTSYWTTVKLVLNSTTELDRTELYVHSTNHSICIYIMIKHSYARGGLPSIKVIILGEF